MVQDKLALLFPGQGASKPDMLDDYLSCADFADRYAIVCGALQYSPLERMKDNPSLLSHNSVSSLLTLLASHLSFERYQKANPMPDYLAGYSVGQYAALHAAGCFDFKQLVSMVKQRADLMDAALEGSPSGMFAVAGVRQEKVEEVCDRLRQEGEQIWISILNCPANFSLSGLNRSIERAMAEVQQLSPRRCMRLPVSGAWHCKLLDRAREKLSASLSAFDWQKPKLVVVDTITGQVMPEEPKFIIERLIDHLTMPVNWEASLRNLVKMQCKSFVEIGYGKVLTEIGFFIDRNLDFHTFRE